MDLAPLLVKFADDARRAKSVTVVFAALCNVIRQKLPKCCICLWVWDAAKKRACRAHSSFVPPERGHFAFPLWLPEHHDISRLLIQKDLINDCGWIASEQMGDNFSCVGSSGVAFLKLSTCDDLQLLLTACIPLGTDGSNRLQDDLVRLLGRTMVHAIERVRLENERELLASISRLRVENQTRRAFYDSVAENVKTAFMAAGCSIFIYDKLRDLLVLGGTTGLFCRTGGTEHLIDGEELVDWTYKRDEGLTGWILQNKKTVRLYDANDVDEVAQFYQCTPTYKSGEMPYVQGEPRPFLAMPIFFEETSFDLVGVIRLHGKTTSACFLPSDEKKLQSVSIELALAVREWDALLNARDSLQQQQISQEHLRSILTLDLEKAPALELVADQAMRLLQGCAASVLLKVDGKSELVIACDKSKRGRIDDAANLTIPMSKGLCGAAATTKQTVAVPNVNEDARFYDLSDLAPGILNDVISEACAPILYGSHLLGVLNVDSDRPGWFRQDDRSKLILLEKLAGEAALILCRHLEPRKHTRLMLAASGLIHQFSSDFSVILTKIAQLHVGLERSDPAVLDWTKRLRELAERLSNYWKELSKPPVFNQPKLEPVCLNDVIERAKTWVIESRTEIRSLNLEIDLDRKLSRTEGKFVAIDYLLFHLVVSDIVSNAVDASAEGGKIRVATAMTSDEQAVLSIQDFGCGIADQDMGKLGKIPFSTKGGNGTGLVDAYKMIALHGGEIKASSIQGKGTTFSVHLPILRKHGGPT